MDRAIRVVRFHGDCQFAQGGSAYDVLHTLETYGICPESAMPFPGSLYGDSLNNFNEFFSLLGAICKWYCTQQGKQDFWSMEAGACRVSSMLILASVQRHSLTRQAVHSKELRCKP